MSNKKRKDREYPLLAAAIKSLRHSELANFYGVYGRLQIQWHLFCTNDEWIKFQSWMKPHIENMMARRISFKVFKDEFADYIERLSNPYTHERLVILVRDAFNCKDDKELYRMAKEVFEIGRK